MQRLLDGKSLRIAFTGGRDSRILLPSAEHIGINLSCYTLERANNCFENYRQDMKIPLVFCENSGVNHKLIFPRETERSNARCAEYRIYTFRYANDADVEWCDQDQYETLVANEDIACLCNSVWETTTEFYQSHIGSSLDTQQVVNRLFAGQKYINNHFV